MVSGLLRLGEIGSPMAHDRRPSPDPVLRARAVQDYGRLLHWAEFGCVPDPDHPLRRKIAALRSSEEAVIVRGAAIGLQYGEDEYRLEVDGRLTSMRAVIDPATKTVIDHVEVRSRRRGNP